MIISSGWPCARTGSAVPRRAAPAISRHGPNALRMLFTMASFLVRRLSDPRQHRYAGIEITRLGAPVFRPRNGAAPPREGSERGDLPQPRPASPNPGTPAFDVLKRERPRQAAGGRGLAG